MKPNLNTAINTSDIQNAIHHLPPKMEYPVEGLGPILGNAAKALARRVQVPIESAAHSILSCASLVTQDKFNVKADHGTIPLSLFCMTVAESGDRKSSCDKIAQVPILEYSKSLQSHYKKQIADFENNIDDKKPINPNMVCTEPTLEGLQKSFEQGRPSQAIFNDEAAQFFGGHAMNKENCLKSVAALSKFWDGAPISRMRVNESFTLHGRRLAVHFMLQPIIIEPLYQDHILMNQGIFARFLIVEPESMAGKRLYRVPDQKDDDCLQLYNNRLTTLLQKSVNTDEHNGLILQDIELSTTALKAWIDFYNQIESELGTGGKYEAIKPTISKMAEQVLRISGVVSVIQAEANISETTMLNAIKLGYFYINQALRIQLKSEIAVHELVISELVEWLNDQGSTIRIAQLQQRSPRKLGLRKSAKICREYMEYLLIHKRVKVIANNSNGLPSEWEIITQ